ncbi:MAG TPA: tagatose 1,6-diphosphate aldolase [Anaerolineaceae bacterium]
MNSASPTLSLGKRRGLLQCADRRGVFNILALDHRQALYKALKTSVPEVDLYGQAVQFKQQIVQALAPEATAFLLDPVLGAGPAFAEDVFPGGLGLIVTVEESGYAGPSEARVSRLPLNWNIARIKRMGASAAKLLVYYHPASMTAPAMRDLIRGVAEDCRRCDLPLFLELLTYPLDASQKELPSQARCEAIVRSAAELSPLGADILKMEFPVDVKQEKDEKAWAAACQALSAASTIPWVLLSAAVDYDVFLRQTLVACQSGASGVLAGRAIWKEALEIDAASRAAFLAQTALERLRKLGDVCAQYARPYTDFYPVAPIREDWQKEYAGF